MVSVLVRSGIDAVSLCATGGSVLGCAYGTNACSDDADFPGVCMSADSNPATIVFCDESDCTMQPLAFAAPSARARSSDMVGGLHAPAV